MTTSNTPSQSYFSGLYFNPSFYEQSSAVSLDYVNQNFLSRINTTASTAPSTLFSNSITTNGMSNTGTLTTDNSIVNNIIISNGLNSYTVSGCIVNANTLSGNFIYESNQLLSNKYLNKLIGGSIAGFVYCSSGCSISGNLYSDNLYFNNYLLSPCLDCISGLISEIGTSAGNDIGVASDINTTLYTFTIPPYFNKSITFSTPISIALASTSLGTYTLSLNSISGTVNKNGSYFTSPAVSTPTLNPLVLSKSVVVANGVNPSAWTSNQFYTNAIMTFTPTYENIVNTYTTVMNANISLPISTTQIIYFNTTTSTKSSTKTAPRTVSFSTADGKSYTAVSYSLSISNPKRGRVVCNDLMSNTVLCNSTTSSDVALNTLTFSYSSNPTYTSNNIGYYQIITNSILGQTIASPWSIGSLTLGLGVYIVNYGFTTNSTANSAVNSTIFMTLLNSTVNTYDITSKYTACAPLLTSQKILLAVEHIL